jgi:3-hydroxybutyryl-CoA dehydrogenase
MGWKTLSDAQRVLIVGAGWIGRQVGLRMAICGLQVSFVDRAPAVTQAARGWMRAAAPQYIEAILRDAAAAPRTSDECSSDERSSDERSTHGGSAHAPPAEPLTREVAQSWERRTDFDRSLESLVDQTQVVLECVPEQIALKRRILREVSRQFPETTIIASNSSYFTPSTLAVYVESPERYAHWHFHVPLDRSSIADISGTEVTAAWVLQRLQRLTEQIYHYPLRLRHEQPGYVFNWLLQSLLRSALELVANDVVDVADIDRAWKAVSGMPLGPFAMMDHIGLDVIEQVLANARWDDAQPVAIDRLLAILREPIEKGHLGVKTGQGFYEHPQ